MQAIVRHDRIAAQRAGRTKKAADKRKQLWCHVKADKAGNRRRLKKENARLLYSATAVARATSNGPKKENRAGVEGEKKARADSARTNSRTSRLPTSCARE